MSKTKVVLFVGFAALLVLAACSDGSGGTSQGVRTFDVKALDALRFEPAAISVRADETVRFVVTNVGKTRHEFVLGDEEIQRAHEEQSGHMDHTMGGASMADAMAVLQLEPGETKEATVTFDQAGEIPFGCHEPGHFKGGMAGAVTVT